MRGCVLWRSWSASPHRFAEDRLESALNKTHGKTHKKPLTPEERKKQREHEAEVKRRSLATLHESATQKEARRRANEAALGEVRVMMASWRGRKNLAA